MIYYKSILIFINCPEFFFSKRENKKSYSNLITFALKSLKCIIIGRQGKIALEGQFSNKETKPCIPHHLHLYSLYIMRTKMHLNKSLCIDYNRALFFILAFSIIINMQWHQHKRKFEFKYDMYLKPIVNYILYVTFSEV